PPDIESIDPTLVPPEHRRIFLEEIEGVIESDGEIAPEERENFRIFEALIG
ncbi:MAG: TerB family tellurite resistance protein, partial [Deltaproteobacteria bacterium]|nr:TerB family tellurite resistance protein [Deltaproteobacteria bacterium]